MEQAKYIEIQLLELFESSCTQTDRETNIQT